MEKLILLGNGKPVRGLLTVCFCFFSLWSFADPVSLQEAVSIADKNPAKALEILSPYLESNDGFESLEEEFLFHLAAARTFLFTGQFEDALKHVEACLSDGSSKNDLDRCKALILKGLILFRVGEYEKADRCGVEGLEIAKEIGNDQQIASAFNLLGNLQFIQGRLDETISYYVKALDLLNEQEDLYSTVKLRANLGNIYLQLGRFEDARSYLEPCYEIVKESGDAQMLLVIGINLAAVYGELGDIAKERSMYEDALEVGKTSGMDSLLEGVYLNLSDLAIRTSQWDEALLHAEQGREIALRIGDNSAEAVALVNIGKANAGLGNFEITFSSFDQAMALFQATQSKLQEIEVLGYYAEYYAKAGQYAKAYEYEVRHNEAVAEMVDEANLEKLAELKALHDSEQQQLKIENLEAEKAKQSLEIEQQELLRQIDQGELEKAKIIRNLLIVVIFAVLLLLAVLFFGYRTQRKSKQELEQLHDELKIKHQELEQLHNQKKQLIEIVSHDLRNPIHGVLGLVDPLREFDEIKNSNEIREILDMLESSANRALEIVKNLLTNAHMESGKFELQLGPCRIHPIMEIAFKENITQARIKNQQLKMEILPDDESICVIADREALIQSISNLISNAVKYTEMGGTIEVIAVQENDTISVSVSDDGQGIPAEEIDTLFIPYATASIKATGGEHSVGLGLSIVKSFVEQMGGSVTCESELGKGSRFTIKIPAVVHF